jgi:hypothetical protein
MLSFGTLDQIEFEALMRSRQREVKEYVSRQEIESILKLENISVNLIQLILNKLIPIVVVK